VGPETATRLDAELRAVYNVVKLAAAVLPTFQSRGTLRDRPFARHRSARVIPGWHEWEDGHLGRQQKHCLVLAPEGPGQVALGCSGAPDFVRSVVRRSLGHQIVGVASHEIHPRAPRGDKARKTQLQFLCVRCGCWARRRSQHLAKPCKPPSRKGAEVLNKYVQGLGPSNRARQIILRDSSLRSLSVNPLRRAQVVARSLVPTVFAGISAAPSYEQRLAALSARVRAKEASAAEA